MQFTLDSEDDDIPTVCTAASGRPSVRQASPRRPDAQDSPPETVMLRIAMPGGRNLLSEDDSTSGFQATTPMKVQTIDASPARPLLDAARPGWSLSSQVSTPSNSPVHGRAPAMFSDSDSDPRVRKRRPSQ
jgi:hypothetical protein